MKKLNEINCCDMDCCECGKYYDICKEEYTKKLIKKIKSKDLYILYNYIEEELIKRKVIKKVKI